MATQGKSGSEMQVGSAGAQADGTSGAWSLPGAQTMSCCSSHGGSMAHMMKHAGSAGAGHQHTADMSLEPAGLCRVILQKAAHQCPGPDAPRAYDGLLSHALHRQPQPALWPAAGLPTARGVECCPAGQLWYIIPLQEALSGGSYSDSSGRLAAGRLPWCAVSLLGQGGIRWPWTVAATACLVWAMLGCLVQQEQQRRRPAAGAVARCCAAQSGLEQGHRPASGAATAAPCTP